MNALVPSPAVQTNDGTGVTNANPKEPMSEEQFRTFLGNEIRDALNYQDSEIAPQRETNMLYYMGEMPDVPPVENRSAVVEKVIADYVGFMQPSLLRTMISGKKIIDYQPKGMQDQDAARVATDYVNQTILRSDNNIENIAWGWCFDGLVNKVGVVRITWKEDKETEDFIVRVGSEMELVQVYQQSQQRGLELVGYQQDPSGELVIKLRQTTDKSRVDLHVLPPEEFVISRDARSLEGARLKSHRCYRYVGELLDEGYDYDAVMRLPGYNNAQFNQEAQIRQPSIESYTSNSSDPMMKKVAVHYGTVWCDKDGTGIKEHYFVAGGWERSIEVLLCEPFEDQIYFADFCPIPLPHVFYGRCPADDLVEIQRVQTVLTRQIMDNIYLTNSPQQEVLVNNIIGQRIEYVQNKSPGGIVPVTALGTVNNITVPFMAGAALGIKQYWDAQAENRTGAGRNQLGLDPEVLQNQSATAAKLADSSTKLKMETIARVWSTGGFRKLGRAILRVLKRRQDFSRMVLMSGQMQEINPQAWAELEDWDVTVNTGLGTGNRERDLSMGTMVIGKMEEILLKLGPDNPIVSLPMYAHALQNMADAAGLNNPEMYFKTMPMDWQPPQQPPPSPPPQVIAAQIKAQSDQMKADKDNAVKVRNNTADNMVDYQLGVREQDIEATLEHLKLLLGQSTGSPNIAKVAGQRTH